MQGYLSPNIAKAPGVIAERKPFDEWLLNERISLIATLVWSFAPYRGTIRAVRATSFKENQL
jgi:hypothetical protein